MNKRICVICQEPIKGKTGYQQWLGNFYHNQCWEDIKDKRTEIHKALKDVCFSHQACPIEEVDKSYTYEGCQRWSCGHIFGAEIKLINLLCKKEPIK